MPGEKTLFRKIQVVLEYAKDEKHDDDITLTEYMLKQNPTNFVYYWHDSITDAVNFGYSEKSIKSTIELCCDLGLLSKGSCELTKVGLNATDPRRFSTILGKRACDLLERLDVPISSIRRAISQVLREPDPVPPTASEISARLDIGKDGITPLKFNRLMNLLGQCEVLRMTQKRVFFPTSG